MYKIRFIFKNVLFETTLKEICKNYYTGHFNHYYNFPMYTNYTISYDEKIKEFYLSVNVFQEWFNKELKKDFTLLELTKI